MDRVNWMRSASMMPPKGWAAKVNNLIDCEPGRTARVLFSIFLVTLLMGHALGSTAQESAARVEEGSDSKRGATSRAIELAREKLEAGDLEGAISELEARLLSSAPSDRELAFLGSLYLAAGRPADAVSVLEPPAAGENPDPRVLFELARSYLSLGRPAEAESSLVRAVEGAPYSRAALLLASLREDSGEFAEVTRLLEPFVIGQVAQNLELRDSAGASEVVFRYAKALIELDQEERAVEHLQKVTRLSPANRDAWQLLGETLTNLNRLEEAYEALAKAQAISEEQRVNTVENAARAKKMLQKAFELRNQGQREAALAALREAIELAPQNPMPRILEVRLLIEMRRDQEALDRAENLVQITDGTAEALHLRGMSKLGLQDLDGAEQDFRRVLEKTSMHRAAMNALALTLMSKGEMNEAEQVLQRVLDQWPDDSVAARNLERIRSLR